jgi:peptidoglycan-N-acetylmuramic acid deacetylase
MKKLVFILIIIFSVIFIANGCKNQENESSKETINKETTEEQQSISEKPNNESEVEEVNQEENIPVVTEPSNKKFAWGFRRMKDSVQPEFTSSYAKVLNDYSGIYVGNKDDKVVYLTFDEGYENGYTSKILDTLKDNNVNATFFVTGSYAKKNKELIQRMIDEGHIIGNHTINHPSMPDLNDEKLNKEIVDLQDYMLEEYNYSMSFIRPPKGEYSERTVKISRDLGYTTVLWSFAYDDWDVNNQKGVEYAKKMIYNNLHNGAVILLHAVSKDNTEVLDDVIHEIINRGYEIKPLSEFKY